MRAYGETSRRLPGELSGSGGEVPGHACVASPQDRADTVERGSPAPALVIVSGGPGRWAGLGGRPGFSLLVLTLSGQRGWRCRPAAICPARSGRPGRYLVQPGPLAKLA